MKENFKDIIIIIGISVFLGIVYNFFAPKPLSLIYHKEIPKIVSDSLLFGNDSALITKVNPKAVPSKLDSMQKIKIDSTKPKIIDSSKVISEENKVNVISYDQMLKIMNNPKFYLVDARNPSAFADSHIGNAVNIFPYADENEYMQKVMSLPEDKSIVVYCDGGHCDASHKLAEIIMNFGYKKVFIYAGGWEEWSQKRGIN